MISPTRYNLNFFIFFPLLSLSLFPRVRGRHRLGVGKGDRLVKEDGFRNIPIRCYKYPQYLCSQCFLIFSCLPPPLLCAPRYFVKMILNQVTSPFLCVYVPALLFSLSVFSW